MGPVVGFWHPTEQEWRAEPVDDGVALVVTHWTEIPEAPGQ
jgi:hypothetical protein